MSHPEPSRPGHPPPGPDWSEAELLAAVEAGPQGPQVGAFFDFDGTLIDGYSLGTFARHHVRSGHVTPVDLGRMLLIGVRGLVTEEDFEQFFLLGMRSWAGRAEDELTELGERLWRQAVAGSLYPEAWRLVAAHRRAGHTVVLASSATRFQVEPAARALGVEHVLVTPVEFVDGLCTGRPGGPPLWRAGKAAAVRAFAPAHGIDLEHSYAYSNGDEDVPFLQTVGRARALNPGAGLQAAAAAHGWPVSRFADRGRVGPRGVARAVGAAAGALGGFGAGLALGTVNRLAGHGSHRDAVDLGLSLAGDLGTALAGVTLEVHGAEHLVAARPAVFLFNHQSQLDVLVLAKLLRGGFTAVAKKEAAAIPGFGAAFRLADVAFVDRGDTTAAKAALEPAVVRLREGVSLVVAPEGTRSVTPALGPFKKGAFHVAMQAGVPIVPIVIHNAGELMWRGAATIREGTVRVTVLPPVPTRDWNVEEMDRRVATVRAQYLTALDQHGDDRHGDDRHGDRDPGDRVPRNAVVVSGGVADGPAHRALSWGTDPEMGAEAAAVWRHGTPRSTLTLLELLDPAPDPQRLIAAHEWASRMVPRMRQTVTEPGWGGAPVWTVVDELDLARHVRRVRLPAPGTHRQLFDVVGAFADAPLDPSRPLWAALLVEGLQGGGAAYAVTVHHSVTDGVGAVRLMGMLHSRTAEHDPDRPEPPVPVPAPPPAPAAALARLATTGTGLVGGLIGDVLTALPDGALLGWAAPGGGLLSGRGGTRRVEVLEVSLAALRAGADAAGGSVHDGFLAAVLHGLRSYHRQLGVDPGDATVALGLPVGLGAQDGGGGRLAGAVVDAPLTHDDPATTVRAARELVLSARPSGPAQAEVQVASLPGIGHPVFLAGSRITRLFPLGPLAGCATTITLVAHDGTACVGIVVDDAAVTDPGLLVDGVREGLAGVLGLAGAG